MSGETEDRPSGWTTDTLKEYTDTRLAAQEKAVEAALAAAEKATGKAEEDIKAWRAQANEWRGAMNDREVKFATHADLAGLSARIDAMEKLMDHSTGRSEGVRLTSGVLVSVVTIAVLALGLIVAVANYAAR